MSYEELKKLAEAATPGPWYWSSPEVDNDLGLMWAKDAFVFKADIDAPANAAYIAAASPDATLKILAEQDALYEALKDLQRAYLNLLETGRDRIVMHGGTCDSVELMEAQDPNLKASRAALALVGEQA